MIVSTVSIMHVDREIGLNLLILISKSYGGKRLKVCPMRLNVVGMF